jgi:hypothetical protein
MVTATETDEVNDAVGVFETPGKRLQLGGPRDRRHWPAVNQNG